MLLQAVPTAGATLEAGRPVWIVGLPECGRVAIEADGRPATVPAGSVTESPIPAPSLDALRAVDDCFGRSRRHFVQEHESRECGFCLFRCRKHGRLFLEDMRGGVGVYTRLILLAESSGDPEALWSRYHAMSDDWLNHLCIAL